MPDQYYSDRVGGPTPRTREEIPDPTWGGIVALVRSHLADGAFGYRFPLMCPDGIGPYGANADDMGLALRAEIPGVEWPLDPDQVPPTLAVLDLVEFCWRAVAAPVQGGWHGFFAHHHLNFEVDAGKAGFRDRINVLFSRGGLCYELGADGRVVRTVPVEINTTLREAQFRTGDPTLDELLDAARRKYFDPDPKERRTGTEKLWDAWERLKTIEPAGDKRASVTLLLDRAASGPELRDVLEVEARGLTEIGNTFRIRHSEVSQVEIKEMAHVDYFFHRLFAFVLMLLRRTGRG